MNWSLVTDWIGEFLGFAILVGLAAFAIKYQRTSTWRATRPGRAIMYQKLGFMATIILLISWSFVDEPPEIRWIFEVIVYTPMTLTVWNMYFALVEQLEGKPNHVFKVNRKAQGDEVQSEVDEDTSPTQEKESNMKVALNTFAANFIRTATPMVAGWLISLLVTLNIPVDPEFEIAIIGLITVAFQAVYYAIVRLLEIHVSPLWGKLLGSSKQPIIVAKPGVDGKTPVITNLVSTGPNSASMSISTKEGLK